MEKIVKVFRNQIGRFCQGSSFVKGEYIPKETVYTARTNYGNNTTLSAPKIRQNTGYQRITQNCMNSLKGQPVGKFK